ncbi:MAG: IS110 family transposase [Marivita sp. XM-24bin2]|uniref:IS110 family transposase n=1 Tax=Marivita sp. XM-24bin2 TaxID=2133951 RepID=UPI000D7AB2FE|nr:IS110 family transposase [Marivita sp. XM-24bin2]PWL27805.1 MAG: IS110 family transposase [Marivita sp. XM-24bin2]
MGITTLGIDLAKSVFQLHGIDADGNVILRKKVRRNGLLNDLARIPPCLIGMEACATSHYWAREIAALGHEVRLLPPAYVKPYVKRQKNDMADAEAICEAVTRPNMHFVAVKSADQQAVLMLHRARDLLVRQRTMLINALRAHLAELGVVSARGPHKIREVLSELQADQLDVPEVGRAALSSLVRQLDALEDEIGQLDDRIQAWHRQSEVSQRLATIPGVGVLTATALAATVADTAQFRSARQFAAWLGLVPRQNSSGGKDRLGRITKMGDGYLRKLLVVGATAVLRRIVHAQTSTGAWVRRLLERKPSRLVSVALANKTARIVFAVLSKKEIYNPA